MINGDAVPYTFMPDLGLLPPGMNLYGAVSPFIMQDLAQGTMCMQGGTCVRHKVMMTNLCLTF